MKRALLALLAAAGCGHGDAALREEQATARKYRDAYEAQVKVNAELKKKMAELEAKNCR
ncbi:MAG TPA: hypothetical protein VMK66_10160 [Myxococcales bacterium]|nr:hypothetical protein [Myxococcales bacterium]